MELALSDSIGGRATAYPAAVISGVVVRAPNGRTHSRAWEAVVDTGADLTILPIEIATELRLMASRQRVRVWTYRKDDPPRELGSYYVRLGLPSGLEVLTHAILSPRKNILIGRCALQKMRLTIDWPANHWSLEDVSFGNGSG